MTSEAVLAAVREAAKVAEAAGELPRFLGELEQVRAEILLDARSTLRQAAPESPRLLSPAEAAVRLGRSRWWVYTNKNALPLVRLPTGGYGFPSDRLDEWIRRRSR